MKDQFAVLAIAVVLVAGYALLVARPQQRALARAGDELRQVRADLEERHDLARSSVVLEAELHATRLRLADYAEQIPSTDRLGDLVAQLSAASQEAGLRAERMAPRQGQQIGQLSVLPIDLELMGGFPNLHEFLRRIETMPRIVRVAGLASRQTGRPGSPLVHELTVYVFHESPPRP
jgi:Tfp pilus assembly protein PilO